MGVQCTFIGKLVFTTTIYLSIYLSIYIYIYPELTIAFYFDEYIYIYIYIYDDDDDKRLKNEMWDSQNMQKQRLVWINVVCE